MTIVETEDGWRKSSFCENSGCVEVRVAGGNYEIRDSENPAVKLTLKPADFGAFKAGVHAGEFDF